MDSANSKSPAVSSDWTIAARARNGTVLCIRPLREEDREREIAFINALSEESRYLRLLTPLKFLPKHLLDQLMDVDGDRRMALIATIGRGEEERMIGIARYGVTDDVQTAEFGITVADDWHQQGIATQLMQHLCRYARSRGFTRLIGLVLAQNSRMLALAHRLGFASHHAEDGLIRVELDLTNFDCSSGSRDGNHETRRT